MKKIIVELLHDLPLLLAYRDLVSGVGILELLLPAGGALDEVFNDIRPAVRSRVRQSASLLILHARGVAGEGALDAVQISTSGGIVELGDERGLAKHPLQHWTRSDRASEPPKPQTSGVTLVRTICAHDSAREEEKESKTTRTRSVPM